MVAKVSPTTGAFVLVVEEATFLPYGTERVIMNDRAVADNSYKFTGHERGP